MDREPYRTSTLSGAGYTEELLNAREERVLEVLGAAERFQRSTCTINHYFHIIVNGLAGLHSEVVKLPSSESIPSEIRFNKKLFPYFKDCIGAADGTHVYAKVPASDVPRFRNRK
ncbi:hypothetical protein EDC01DRAFT_620736, partial [Geopyxis carbonaria]